MRTLVATKPKNEVKKRIEAELRVIAGRIKELGGPTPSGLNEVFGGLTAGRLNDDMDVAQQNDDREMSFASRAMLIARAQKLSGALERLRDGQYGTCGECGEPISPARLRVMPEVATCVECQGRLEQEAKAGTWPDRPTEDEAEDL